MEETYSPIVGVAVTTFTEIDPGPTNPEVAAELCVRDAHAQALPFQYSDAFPRNCSQKTTIPSSPGKISSYRYSFL